MSYCTWHTYGIGINTDNIETTEEKLKEFVNLAPNFKRKLEEWADEEYNRTGEHPEFIDIYSDYGDFGSYGLAGYIYEVVHEAEDIYLCPCNDYDSCNYILYSPNYPWECSTREKTLTEEKLKEIFEKYISCLTEQTLEELGYDRQEVENGG